MADKEVKIVLKIDSKTGRASIKSTVRELDKLKKPIDKANTSAKGFKKTMDSINFKKIGVSAAAATAVVVLGMSKAIKAASDLQEVQGKFDVVFKDQKVLAERWSKTLVDSYIMSTREAKQYLSSVQDLLVPMGMASDEAGRMSMEVVKLSAELASFNNLPTASVMADIQSALVGNYETMKKHGVVINETIVKQEALSRGLWNGKGMVDANTKAFIAYQLMLKGSAAAIGDVERTSRSYANQLKKFKANTEDLTAAIGDELLPVMTAWLEDINTYIKDNPKAVEEVGKFAKQTLELAESVGKVTVNLVSLISKLTEINDHPWWKSTKQFLAEEEVKRLGKLAKLLGFIYDQMEHPPKPQIVRLKIVQDVITPKPKVVPPPEVVPPPVDEGEKGVTGTRARLSGYMQTPEQYKPGVQAITEQQWEEQFGRSAEMDERAANHETILQYTSTEEENKLRAIENERTALLELATTETQIREINMAADEIRNEAMMTNFQRWASEAKSSAQILEEVAISAAENFASGFSNAFMEFADGTKSAKEAFEDFARSFLSQVAKMIMQMLILKAIQGIASAIGGGVSGAAGGVSGGVTGGLGGTSGLGTGMTMTTPMMADGGVFSQGHKMTAYANGGIVGSPTLFPMADGIGLMGEEAPEAVMPLKRTTSGKLGVESSGEGQPTAVNVTYNINAIDAASFAELTRRNPEAISGPLISEIQSGNMSLRQAINVA